jgi:predicted dehydrogenase
LRHINASFRFLLDRPNTIKMQAELGGGALYDVGCYPVNFLGMVTGRLPQRCQVLSEIQQGVDTNLSALLQYDDGLIANIHCGFNAFGRNYAEIIGDKGLLCVDTPFLDDAEKYICIPLREYARFPSRNRIAIRRKSITFPPPC